MTRPHLRPTLGVYGPGPDDHTGVARYIKDSLPWLRGTFDVHWHHGPDNADPVDFDFVLYHLGNNRFHHGAFRALRRRPGPAILHEFNTFAYYLRAWDDVDDREKSVILSLLGRELGVEVRHIAEAERIANEQPVDPSRAWDIGVERLALENARPAVVHSTATLNLLASRHPWASLMQIPLPVTVVTTADPDAARDRLGIPRDHYLFGLLGFQSPAKQTDLVVDAWTLMSAETHGCTLLVAGEDLGGTTSRGAARSVSLFGFLPDDCFDALLDTVDCGIHLRNPSMGESSGVVAALLARGKAVIVSDPYDALAPADGRGIVRIHTGDPNAHTLHAAMRGAANHGRTPYTPDQGLWPRWTSLVVDAVLADYPATAISRRTSRA